MRFPVSPGRVPRSQLLRALHYRGGRFSLAAADLARRHHHRHDYGPSFIDIKRRFLGRNHFRPGGPGRSPKRVAEAIQHEQVRVEEKTKRDQCSLWSFSDGLSRSCKMEVWRNLDQGSASWTVRLDGPGRRALVLDCPDLSGGGKIAMSQESLNLGQTDTETATVTAHEDEVILDHLGVMPRSLYTRTIQWRLNVDETDLVAS